MRILRVGAAAIAASTVIGSLISPAGSAFAGCGEWDPCDQDEYSEGPDPGWDSKHPVWGTPYCERNDEEDDDDDEQTVNPFPFHETRLHGYWRTQDGGLLSDNGNGTDVGPIKTHQSVTHWCAATKGGPPGIQKETFWMPLVNPDTIVFNRGLMARVEAQLQPAEINWLNMDIDHDWLWVRVEHFAAVEPVPEIFVEDWAGDEVTGTAHAWIRAYPVEFKVTVPGVEGTDGISSCDLTMATSDEGCPIRFTHASAIDPSGEFTLSTELVYEVESNSGKYTGVRFSREATSTVTVAEAMAVTVYKGD